jgi:hypothetical protein
MHLYYSFVPAVIVLSAFAMSQNGLASENEARDREVWGEPAEGQAISISTPQAPYAAGDVISLVIHFKNVGDKEIMTSLTVVLEMYDVTVLLPDGKNAPLTLYGKCHSSSNVRSGSAHGLPLKPGQIHSSQVVLSRIFDMTLPGKYTIFVERCVWKPGTKRPYPKAVSNKLEIAISDMPAQTNLGRK